MRIVIRRATAADADMVAPLFDAYRAFYGRASDVGLARRFLADRLADGSSILIVAGKDGDGDAIGFVQLYPTFSSLGAGPAMILNDLYVEPGHRGQGVAERLIAAAVEAAREGGAVGLSLVTQRDNVRAQALYERLGWTRDDQFLTYEFNLIGSDPP